MGLLRHFQNDWAVRKSDRLARRGKTNEALWTIEGALVHSPENVDLRIQRIWLLADLKKYDEALLAAENTLGAAPKNAILHMLRGEVLLKTHQAEKAKEALHEALALSGENIRIEYLLGLAYVALNDMDKASQYFESSVRYDKFLVQSRLLAMAERYLFLAQKGSGSL